MSSKLQSVFIAFLFAVLFNSISSDGKQPQEQLLRLVSGNKTTKERHPYLVGLIKSHKGWRTGCEGSLISSTCVLTARHCFGYPINAIMIRSVNGGVKRKVKYQYLPSAYGYKASDMDIVVYKFDKPLEGENIKPIEIDYTPIKKKDIITITGWGSSQLREANFTDNGCDNSPNQFCLFGNKKRIIEAGDSGSPAIRNGKQVGSVSWNTLGGDRNKIKFGLVRFSSRSVSEFLRNVTTTHCGL